MAGLCLTVATHAQDPIGQWEFNGDLTASFGSDITYRSDTQTVTEFGTTEGLGIPAINGESASVMRFPKTNPNQGYSVPIPNVSNGGGSLLNNWTVIFDIFYPPESSDKPRGLLDIVDAQSGGIAGSEFFVGADNGLGYFDTTHGSLSAGAWHRVAFVVDFDNSLISKYIDGTRVGTQAGIGGFPDGVWALFQEVGLFTDDNDETELGYINSLQLRDQALTPGQIAAFGGPAADGVPPAIPAVPSFLDRWIPSTDFARRDTQVGVVINKGSTTIEDSSIRFEFNGTDQSNLDITRSGDLITIIASDLGPLSSLSDNTMTVVYTDSKDGEKSFTKEFRVPVFYEDFNELELGPPVDESSPGEEVWTNIPPEGWSIDNSQMAALDDDSQGVHEWEGWSFADVLWWPTVDDQRRSEFTKATGAAMIADPDEWDDKGDPEALGTYNTSISTPQIDISGLPANSLFVQFDSSWRPEDNQKVRLEVSFDGGAPTELFRWTSDPADANFKDDNSTNESLTFPLNNPEGASNLVLTFIMFDAGNDWWWAVDNLVVDGGTIPAFITQHPTSIEVTEGESATFEVVAGGSEPLTYQWYKGIGDMRVAIDGATSASFTINQVSQDDAGLYTVNVSNEADTVTSNPAELKVLLAGGSAVVFFEDFEGLPLGPNVDEGEAGEAVWTKTPPEGWSIDDSQMPALNDPDNGVTEWQGWSFANKDWWVAAAGNQDRALFSNGIGTVAVADPDEWDDKGDPEAFGFFNSVLITPDISLDGIKPGSLVLKFSSSWRDEDSQTAAVTASFDGGEPIQVLRYSSDPNSPDFKDDTPNETVTIAIDNPEGASSLVLNFALTDAGNDWWWAIDNVELTGEKEPIFAENFDSLELGPNVDESEAGDAVWTKTPPSGWMIDDSNMPGLDDDTQGVTEWSGWSFADKDWWIAAAGDQDRGLFSKGSGVVAIADPDEWDDKGDPEALGFFHSFLRTPSIDLTGVEANTAILKFDSSWRDEDSQTAIIEVSYGGGDPVEVLRWESDPNSPNFHDDAPNETITVPLNNPDGAGSMVISFGMIDAGNDWWWAIDNIEVIEGVAPPLITEQPTGVEIDEGGTATFTVSASGGVPFTYQWYKGQGAERTAIAGAVGPTLTVENATLADSGFYSVDVTNSAGTATSAEAFLNVVLATRAMVILTEDFEGLPLGPNVDESSAGENVWTKTPPEGWSIDDSQMPALDDPDHGMTEWEGWSFADKSWWVTVDDQRRSEFDKASGTVAIADPDEWDDKGDPESFGFFNSFLISKTIDLTGLAANSVVLRFNSSWRPEDSQTAVIRVSFDGGEPVEVLKWTSQQADPTFKPDAVNETVGVAIDNPAGASSMVITFGMIDAGNDWWWAIDNVEVSGDQAFSVLFAENFDALELGPNVDETTPGDNVWTKTPPAGWMIDDSNMAGIDDPTQGVTEWSGWSFADKDWWISAAGDQERSFFTKGSGVVAVADPDEWDDKGDPESLGSFNSFLSTPSIDISGAAANTVFLRFDSSWRDDPPQKAIIEVSFDGGDPVEILRWESESGSPNFHDDSHDETVMIPVNNPDGASSMVISFGLIDAGNDWWWAVDNVQVLVAQDGAPAGPRITGVSVSGADVTLTWEGGAGIKVQKTASLSNPDWQDVAGSEGQSSITDTVIGETAYYRLVQE